MREKCKLLKGNSITNLLSKDPPVVSLGRGILYMSKMKKEFKEASALWGFPCIKGCGLSTTYLSKAMSTQSVAEK